LPRGRLLAPIPMWSLPLSALSPGRGPVREQIGVFSRHFVVNGVLEVFRGPASCLAKEGNGVWMLLERSQGLPVKRCILSSALHPQEFSILRRPHFWGGPLLVGNALQRGILRSLHPQKCASSGVLHPQKCSPSSEVSILRSPPSSGDPNSGVVPSGWECSPEVHPQESPSSEVSILRSPPSSGVLHPQECSPSSGVLSILRSALHPQALLRMGNS